jgi:hypothetical protein
LVDLLGIERTELGNGFCQKCLNVADCLWDGGDCCLETCQQLVICDDLDADKVLFVMGGMCNFLYMECVSGTAGGVSKL